MQSFLERLNSKLCFKNKPKNCRWYENEHIMDNYKGLSAWKPPTQLQMSLVNNVSTGQGDDQQNLGHARKIKELWTLTSKRDWTIMCLLFSLSFRLEHKFQHFSPSPSLAYLPTNIHMLHSVLETLFYLLYSWYSSQSEVILLLHWLFTYFWIFFFTTRKQTLWGNVLNAQYMHCFT